MVYEFYIANLPIALGSSSRLHIFNAATGSRVSDITCDDQAVVAAAWHPAQSSIFLTHDRGVTAIGFAPLTQAVADGVQSLVI